MNAPTQKQFLGKYPSLFLSLVSAANLILGLLFYVAPSTFLAYWPWPVKELAMRFLGAIFLAIALGCWSALKAKLWQRAKILVLVGATFFGLTGLVTLANGITTNNSLTTWAWTGYFLTAGAGCLILLKLYGWHRRQAEASGHITPLKGAKVFFGIQTSVVGVFGAMMLLLPALAQQQFWPWKVATPSLETFGALFLATCLATGWAFLQRDPLRIIVLLPLDAIFPSLALLAVGLSWNVIVAESPSWPVTTVWLFLYSFVAVGSTILYIILGKNARSHDRK